VILGFVALASAEVYFEEKFLDGKRETVVKIVVGVLAGDDGEELMKLSSIVSIFLRQQFGFSLY
jgi:hypothetical protein